MKRLLAGMLSLTVFLTSFDLSGITSYAANNEIITEDINSYKDDAEMSDEDSSDEESNFSDAEIDGVVVTDTDDTKKDSDAPNQDGNDEASEESSVNGETSEVLLRRVLSTALTVKTMQYWRLTFACMNLKKLARIKHEWRLEMA
jgi:hypothetical protein